VSDEKTNTTWGIPWFTRGATSHAHLPIFPCAVEPGRRARLAPVLAESDQALTLPVVTFRARRSAVRFFLVRVNNDFA
jgi:hypothetical protein